MQVRRLLLFIGILMLLALAAGSLIPPPDAVEENGSGGQGRTEAIEPPAEEGRDAAEPVEIDFRAQSSDGERSRDEGGTSGRGNGAPTAPGIPSSETVASNRRVVISVEVAQPAQVELEGLGLLESATPGDPAVFDLFTDRPGRYAVLYTPAGGEERRIGVLVVEEAPTRSTRRPRTGAGTSRSR